MEISREDAQKRPTLTKRWMTQDADVNNYQLQWKTEKYGACHGIRSMLDLMMMMMMRNHTPEMMV